MAITTVNGIVAGLKPLVPFYKTTGTMKAAGLTQSLFYAAGVPGPAVASTDGLAGAALTSYPGQLSIPAAVGGNSVYLARLDALQTSAIGSLTLADRLWHNSGFGVTTLTAQTINSAALPARDANNTINGEGVLLAMEVATVLGSGTPTLTVTYTNSAGVGSRTGTIGPILTTLPVGTFYTMAMAAGDKGVKSIQSITTSATMTSGAVSFVLYRELATLPMPAANFGTDRDAVALGFPLVADSAVPFLIGQATGTGTTVVDGSLVWAQG